METLVVEAAPVDLRSDNVAGIAPGRSSPRSRRRMPAPRHRTARIRSPRACRTSSPSCSRRAASCSRWRPEPRPTRRAGADRAALRCGLLHRGRPRARQRVRGGRVLYRRRRIVPLAEQHGAACIRRPCARRCARPGRPYRPGPAGGAQSHQATERGTVYGLGELDALIEVARSYGLRVHMDGARFANAIAALGCCPADATWRRGVDVLSFGAPRTARWAPRRSWCSPTSWPSRCAFGRAARARCSPRCASSRRSSRPTCRPGCGCASPHTPMRWRAIWPTASPGRQGVRLIHPVEINEIFAMPRAMIDGLLAELRPVRSRRRRGAPGHRLQQHETRSTRSSRRRAGSPERPG